MARIPDDPTKAQVWITGDGPEYGFEFYFPRGAKGEPGGFTYGVDLATSNLNDIKTSGIYRLAQTQSGLLLRNFPRDYQDSGVLTVFERLNGATPTVFQEWRSLNQQYRTLYTRTFDGGANLWTPWKSFASSRVDTTAGRAIYQWDDVNNRDQLVYGDTGRRNISPATQSSGGFILSRSGVTVTLLLADYQDTGTGGTISWPGLIPAGFRPANWVYMPIPSGRTLTIQNGGTVSSNAHSSTVYQGSISWRTDEAWPTMLPGSAVGSIPNL